MRKWFVIHTKSKCELKVKLALERQGIEVFLPCYKIQAKIKSCDTMKLTPLFPAYIFTRLDPDEVHWRAINSTRGVLCIVGCNKDKLSAISDAYMEDLLVKADSNGVIELSQVAPSESFSIGDNVKILSGLWVDKEGVIIKSAKERVTILLTLLFGSAEVILNSSTIRRL